MAFGFGKVILLGEHGVVYARPALAAAIGRGVTATATASPSWSLEIEPWGVRVFLDRTARDRDAEIARAFHALIAQIAGGVPAGPTNGGGQGEAGKATPSAAVHVTVDLPAGGGLGCSAAIGVAIVRAIGDAFGVARTDAEVAEVSLAWERVFHGNPSGVDSAMAASGGVALYRRGEALERVTLRRPLHLVIGDSGEPSSTKRMVEGVARQHARAPDRVDQVFDGMAALVHNGRIAVEAGDLSALGQLFDLNQALLNTLMVSTNVLEEMCAAARTAGALGAKLTGGGGGGCMIALVADEQSGERVLAALRELKKTAFLATVGAGS